MKELIYSACMAIVLILLVIGTGMIVYITMSGVGDALHDAIQLDNAPCQNITIIDTFSESYGYMGSYTYYCLVGQDKSVYKMYFGINMTDIYRWKSIERGQSYSLKIYKNDAEFCDQDIIESSYER